MSLLDWIVLCMGQIAFMSIAVRKNHLPGIGAHSVEKGLKINITHLKYIILLFNM